MRAAVARHFDLLFSIYRRTRVTITAAEHVATDSLVLTVQAQ